MVRLPRAIVNCVCFVGSRRPDGTVLYRGTAFLLARHIPGQSTRMLGYAITARHVDAPLLPPVSNDGGHAALVLPLAERVEHAVTDEMDCSAFFRDGWLQGQTPQVAIRVSFAKVQSAVRQRTSGIGYFAGRDSTGRFD